MTLRVGGALLVLFAVAACGGRAQNASPATGAGGDPPSSDAPGEPSAGERSASGEAGAAGDGGAAGGYTALIASGTRTCENEDYCFGLACYAPASFFPTMCLARCETNNNCQPSEACLRAPALAPTCYARCKSPADCYEGFDCFDFAGNGDEFVCFPRRWVQDRDKLGY